MKNLCFLVVILILPVCFALDHNNLAIRAEEVYNFIEANYTLGEDVRIITRNIGVGAAEAKRYPGDLVIILDSDKLEGISDEQLKGLMAHEMAHLEIYLNKTWIEMVLFSIRYELSADFRKSAEREADMNSISKGFGKELEDFRTYRLQTASPADRKFLGENYLSPEEIHDYLERGQ